MPKIETYRNRKRINDLDQLVEPCDRLPQDISYSDDNNRKRELLRGNLEKMAIDYDLQSKNIAKARTNVYLHRDTIKATAINEPAQSSTVRYRLESLSYYGLKIVLMAILLSGITSRFTNEPYTDLLLFIMAVGLQIMTFLKKPYNHIVPIRKKRSDIGKFYHTEIKFILFISTAFLFMPIEIDSRIIGLFLLANLTVQSILFYLWRRYNLSLRAHSYSDGKNNLAEQNIIIVGAGERGQRAVDIFCQHSDLNANIIGFVDFQAEKLWRYRDIPLLGHADNLEEIVATRQVDYIVIATEPDDYMYSREIFAKAEKMGINICILPDIYDHDISNVRSSSINGHPILMYCATKNCQCYNVGKLIMDKIGAFLGLLISAPVLLFSAIAIKLDSHGPIFFKQERTGRNGKIFKMWKLRTMTNGADKEKEKLQYLNEMSGPVFKIKNDPRITRVGKFLRKFSIDEFPQFINILKGDMSLVGPRPPLPKEVAEYEDWQRRRLAVKPGATCLWQINGRNHVDFEKWIKLDLKYIDNWSLREDARIILKTFPAVLRGNGAS